MCISGNKELGVLITIINNNICGIKIWDFLTFLIKVIIIQYTIINLNNLFKVFYSTENIIIKRVKPIHEGYHPITAHLVVNDAADAIKFYKHAFDTVEV